jgi:DNA-binding CsgD family transcriptional regulator
MTTWTTHKEVQLFQLLIGGHTAGEIAVMLGVRIRAVRAKLREMGVRR